MTVLEIIGQILALIGAAIFVVAAVGLSRFKDPYSRISAVATAAGLGVAFVTVGAVLIDPSVDAVVKVVLAVILQLLTSAVAAIVIARAALGSRHRFVPDTDTSELGDDTSELGDDD